MKRCDLGLNRRGKRQQFALSKTAKVRFKRGRLLQRVREIGSFRYLGSRLRNVMRILTIGTRGATKGTNQSSRFAELSVLAIANQKIRVGCTAWTANNGMACLTNKRVGTAFVAHHLTTYTTSFTSLVITRHVASTAHCYTGMVQKEFACSACKRFPILTHGTKINLAELLQFISGISYKERASSFIQFGLLLLFILFIAST